MNNEINPLLDELLQNAAYWNRRLSGIESGTQNETKAIVSALFNTDTKLIELSVNKPFMNDIIKDVYTWGVSVNKFAVSHKLKEYFISKYIDSIGTEILGYLFGESGNSELKLPEEVKKKIKQKLLTEPL